MNKDIQQLIRALQKQGFHVRLARSGHYRATSPTTGRTVTVPATPRRRSITNTVAKLRHNGAQL
jgi:predicted RNA binding protein YcfA (HicA-like mRNA interferase family)